MDPKTGKVAEIEPEIDAKPTPEGEKPAKPSPTPQQLAREEIARRIEAKRLADERSFTPDVLQDDGSITPSPLKPIVKAVGEAMEEIAKPQEPSEEPENEAEEPQQVHQSEPVEPETTPAPSLQTEPEEERELIVDGKHIKVPLSKIIDAGTRTLQKETAADARLAAATQLLQQAQERARQVQQSPDALPEAQDRREPSQEPDDAALARAIQFGTEAEAATALKALRSQGRSTDPKAVVDLVRQSLMVQLPQQVAFQSANEWVRGEYKEIFSDPDLQQLFMQQESRRRQEGDQRPYRELYKDIADTLVTKFKLRQQEVKSPPAEPMPNTSDRLTRKMTAPRIAQAAGGKTAAPPEQKPETLAEYIERTRRARGQQPQLRS